jgi:hypothetical protein
VFCLRPVLIDLAGDEFWKAPPMISIGCLMPKDAGSDEVRWCVPMVSLGSDAKLCYMLPSKNMSFFISMEKTVAENGMTA